MSNYNKILEILDKHDISASILADNYNLPNELGVVERVDHYGGEGQGELYYDVLYFKDFDVYVKIRGYYYSYDGIEYYDDAISEVKPVKKEITVFE